jgi:UDP-glucose 4-epimerase
MRVAVTGAGGYLGRPIVDALARDERVESVVAIDVRPPAPAGGGTPADADGARASVEPVCRDVRDPALERDLAGANAVVHLAAVVLGRGKGAWSINVEGSRNLFRAAAGAGVRTIVHASSAAAYGCAPDNAVPLSEESPLRPEPPFYYPQTKVAAERELDEIERLHGELRVVRMRPVSTLGPGAPLMLGGRAFVTLSDFDPLIQFTWIDDVVDAFVAALHAPVRGAFNVGAPVPVLTSEVPALLGVRRLRARHRVLRAAARAGSALRLPGALHPGWVDMGRYPIVVDAGRAERELGWRASCDCATALRRFGMLLRGEPDAPVPAMQREAAT